MRSIERVAESWPTESKSVVVGISLDLLHADLYRAAPM
jgi:hypothetical protein